MAGLTADQIIERIANANGIEPVEMRKQIKHALRKIIADTSRPHSFMLAELFLGNPTVDERIVALEHELYSTLMPQFPGWEWDGERYWNTGLYGKKL